MEKITLNEKLNRIFELIPIKKSGVQSRISFCCGDYLKNLSTLLKGKVSYGKVAIFSLDKTFIEIGSVIKKELLKLNISTIDYTVSKNEKITIDTISKLFVLPDDIRVVIVLSSALSKVGDYFAFLKHLPLIDISCGLDIGEYLESAFYIKNGNVYDSLCLNPKKEIIVDTTLCETLKIPKSFGYDYIINNIISTIDLRVNAYCNKNKIDVGLYNIKSRAISSSFTVIKQVERSRIDFLTVNCALVGIVNNILGFEFLENNSLINLSLLYFEDEIFDSNFQIYFSKKLLKLFALFVNDDIPKYTIPAYNETILNCEKFSSLSQEYLLDNIFSQRDVIQKNEIDIKKIQEMLSKEVNSIANNFDKFIHTHILLGGGEINGKVDLKRLKNCVKCANTLRKGISCLYFLSNCNLI